jgi:hypothetical protein
VVWVSDDRSVNRELLALPNRLDLVLGRVQEVLGDRVTLTLPERLPRAIMTAVNLMLSHCREPLTLDEIAARVGVSEPSEGGTRRRLQSGVVRGCGQAECIPEEATEMMLAQA